MTATSGFVTIAARPALDLCNTRLGDRDLLTCPEDLARWFVETGHANHAPRISRRELEAARELRDGLRPALLEADGQRVAEIAEDWLGRAPGRLCVERETLRPRFAPEQESSCCLLVAAVVDALDLVRESPGRVRECADPACRVVYLDTSRNRSRRWCSMDRCGARAKASAYYRRHRACEGP